MSWHPLEEVDESFFTTAPHVYRYPVELNVSPERVWESLVSDGSLADWGMGIKLRWTSPRPFGVGTTREVVLPLNLMIVRERFFLWDEGKRYAFYVESANRPIIKRFAEDYLVEKTDTGSRFTWTIAIEPQPKVRRLVAAGGPINRIAFGQTARSAKKYFATAPHIYSFMQELPVAPERVWESLASDHSVADWTPLLNSIEWTSPRPFGVGTTRTVVLPTKAITIHEYFFRWEEGHRFSFYGVDANLPLFSRFAEDYVVEPSGSGTRFTWTFALEGTPKTRLAMKAMSPVNRANFGAMARGAKGYFAKHP